jgi:hypothetical protein
MFFITSYCHLRNRRFSHNGNTLFQSAGTLDEFMENAYAFLGAAYPKFHKMDRLSKLGFLAAEPIIRAHPLLTRYAADQIAVVLANAHASLDTDMRFQESARTIASPALFVYTLPNIVTGELCIRHGLKGENAFFVMKEFDAEQLSQYVDLVMTSGKTQACLAGWIDVMGDDDDVFLYLVEKQGFENRTNHTPHELRRLYQLTDGTTHD